MLVYLSDEQITIILMILRKKVKENEPSNFHDIFFRFCAFFTDAFSRCRDAPISPFSFDKNGHIL